MKNLLRSLALISFLFVLAPHPARGLILLDSQTVNVSSTPQSIMVANIVYVQVRSTSTSIASVTIETSLDQLAWTTQATIVNPTSTGEIWSGPGGGFLRVTIAGYGGGTITVKANAVNGKDILF